MSTRISRYTLLREKGLFQKEAKEFSKNEIEAVPYFKLFLRDRRKILRKWLEWKASHHIEEGKGSRKYHNMVREWYRTHGWMTNDGKVDVWKAWRDYEKKWKDKTGDYPKPSKKRRSDLMITEKKLRTSLGY
jgi:hypothetical protein